MDNVDGTSDGSVARRRRRIVRSSAIAIAIVPVLYVGVALGFGVVSSIQPTTGGVAAVLIAPLVSATAMGAAYRRISDERAASWVFAVSFVGGVVVARGLHYVVGGPDALWALL